MRLPANDQKYLHNARHPSHSNGQVRGPSGQEFLASDGEDSPPSFGSSLRGHGHDKRVLKKERRKETVIFRAQSPP